METRLSTKQLADRLCVKPETVQAWRSKGGGPRFLRVAANRVCYRLADVEAWEAERLHENTSEESAARKRAA